MDLKTYRCPNCAGALRFDVNSQKVTCFSCGTVVERGFFEEPEIVSGDEELFDVAAPSGVAGDEELFDVATSSSVVGDDELFDVAASSGVAGGGEEVFDVAALAGDEDAISFECFSEVWENIEDDDLTSGECPSCGAELYGGKTAAAMVCPCCGNAQIIAKRISGMLKPNYIIPFKLDKDAATAALSEFYEGKRLLPDSFTTENRVTDLQGVYAPFWLFDARAEGSITYHATKVTGSGKSRHITHYTVFRDGSMNFEKIPVDGSLKMDDEYMDAIEPFNYRQLEEFHPSYLAGYAAEKYDVDAETSKKRARSRIVETIDRAFKASAVGYNTLEVTDWDIDVKDGKVGYGLFPVWTLNTKYENDNYLFMMNGQTGKLVGRLPVDERKASKYMWLLTGGFFAAILPLMYFFFTADITEALSESILNDSNKKKSIIELIAMIIYFLASADVTVLLPIIVIASFVISMLIGKRIVGKWRRQMDTVEKQETAFIYAPTGVDFMVKDDIKENSFRFW